VEAQKFVSPLFCLLSGDNDHLEEKYSKKMPNYLVSSPNRITFAPLYETNHAFVSAIGV